MLVVYRQQCCVCDSALTLACIHPGDVSLSKMLNHYLLQGQCYDVMRASSGLLENCTAIISVQDLKMADSYYTMNFYQHQHGPHFQITSNFQRCLLELLES